MSAESQNKEKTMGQEAILRQLEKQVDELHNKWRRHWITEEQYNAEREKLENERLEILTRPDLG